MKISNIKNNNKGFTLIELVIVIAGLAALGSFAFPNLLNSIKLNKIEEAKAVMNGYASDCLGKFRISTDPVEFIENTAPDQLDNTKLSTLGYQIDGDKNKCSHLAIKPIKENEGDIYAFDFRMSSEGRILKTATPSNNPRFLNSCRGWAGQNCGLSDAQKAEFERLAALAKAKSECVAKYNSWLGSGSSGEFLSWDSTNETCTRSVYAFEGVPVNSLEAVDQALKAKYGRACLDWRSSKRNTISPNGAPETKNPECGGVNYWFHSGNEFTTQAAWTDYDNKLKAQACVAERSEKLTSDFSGKHTYGPNPGPEPCGKTVWLCSGEEYNSPDAWRNTPCGRTPTPDPGPVIPPHCVNFRPDPMCSWRKSLQGTPSCVCK